MSYTEYVPALYFIFGTVSIHEILNNVSKFCCQSSLPYEYNIYIFLSKLLALLLFVRADVRVFDDDEENYVSRNIMSPFFLCPHNK